MIKAIETPYRGIKFRSRLEARWAVFFDELKILYLYEAEGFDIDGVWYLPDFYLPAFDTYVEIKPSHDISMNELNKINKLAQYKSLFVVYGNPAPYEGDINPGYEIFLSGKFFKKIGYGDMLAPDDKGDWLDGPYILGACEKCSSISFHACWVFDYHNTVVDTIGCEFISTCKNGCGRKVRYPEYANNALLAGKQTRF